MNVSCTHVAASRAFCFFASVFADNAAVSQERMAHDKAITCLTQFNYKGTLAVALYNSIGARAKETTWYCNVTAG